MVTRAARAVNPPIFTLFVQGGQGISPQLLIILISLFFSHTRRVGVFTLTTLDTSSREEVRP